MALYQNLNTLHQYLLVAFKILGLPISLKAGELSLIFKKSNQIWQIQLIEKNYKQQQHQPRQQTKQRYHQL
jgi:hypothetical protein